MIWIFALLSLGFVLLVLPPKGLRLSMNVLPFILLGTYSCLGYQELKGSYLNQDFIFATQSTVSYGMVLLTFLVMGLAHLTLYQSDFRLKELSACSLLLTASLVGAFSTDHLLVFYICFEFALIPLYLMISGWGGDEKERAAKKFFLFTFAGSLLMLLGFLGLHQITGTWILTDIKNQLDWSQSVALQAPIFGLILAGLLVKAPMFPFHAWMPLTYTQSPHLMMVYSALVLKLGSYGLFLLLPLFPNALVEYQNLLLGASAIGVLYGAIMASIQQDLRGVMAYSSLSHMGFLLLGLFSLTELGKQAALYQQISHTLITAVLFYLSTCIYLRTRTYQLEVLGGLRSSMQNAGTLFLIATLASVGLPGTSGFIGEFLSLFGTWQSGHILWTIIAGGGVIFSAVFMLRVYQAVFYGEPFAPQHLRAKDLHWYEKFLPAVFLALILLGGIIPKSILDWNAQSTFGVKTGVNK